MRSGISPTVRSGSQLQFTDNVGSVRFTPKDEDGLAQEPRVVRVSDVAMAEAGPDGWIMLHEGGDMEGLVEFLPAVAVCEVRPPVAESAAAPWAIPSVNPSEAARQDDYEYTEAIRLQTEQLDSGYCGTCGNSKPECRGHAPLNLPEDRSHRVEKALAADEGMISAGGTYTGQTVVQPQYTPSKYGHSRSGPCGCGWSPKLHGDICPEHGTHALVEPAFRGVAAAFQELDRTARPLTGSGNIEIHNYENPDPIPTVEFIVENPEPGMVIGDVVRIRYDESRREMTLAAVNGEHAKVQWFEGETLHDAEFLLADLAFVRRVDSYVQPSEAEAYHAAQLASVPEGFAPQVVKLVRERGSAYGTPAENHQLTADLWSAWLSRRLRTEVRMSAEDVCMLNILQKESRLAFTTKDDSWFDIAGYTENVAMLKAEQRNA